MSGWDWKKDEVKPHIVVPKTEALAVYLNHLDQLVIRQQGEYDESDNMIIIPVGYREALIEAILKAKPL